MDSSAAYFLLPVIRQCEPDPSRFVVPQSSLINTGINQQQNRRIKLCSFLWRDVFRTPEIVEPSLFPGIPFSRSAWVIGPKPIVVPGHVRRSPYALDLIFASDLLKSLRVAKEDWVLALKPVILNPFSLVFEPDRSDHSGELSDQPRIRKR